MDRDTQRLFKKIELDIGLLKKEDRLLRERISVASGDSEAEFYIQGALGGSLSSGDGISGGGTFPGIVSISIDLSATSGLEFSSGKLQIADSVAGGGLTISSKVLAVGAGDGITINANDIAITTPGTLTVSTSNASAGNHTHSVTSNSNPGAAASILASDASGYLQLTRLGAGMAPSSPITSAGYVYAEGDGVDTGYLSYRYSDDVTASYWSARKARGSVSSPAVVEDEDVLWNMNAEGHDGSAFRDAANIYIKVDGTPGASDMPGKIEIHLTPDGSASPELAFSIENDKQAYFVGDVTIETRCFGFLKAKSEGGLVGNGPVETGETVAICGYMYVAPGSALYEEVTIN